MKAKAQVQLVLLGTALFAVAVILLALAVLALPTRQQANCLKWEETGGLDCYGDANYRHCEPTKRCVEWKES